MNHIPQILRVLLTNIVECYENSNTNARTQVQEQRGRDLAEAVENAQSGKAVEYERLQQEFADYKRRVNLLVQEREYALQEARAKLSRTRNGTGSSASDGKVVSDSELSNVTAPSPSTWCSSPKCENFNHTPHHIPHSSHYTLKNYEYPSYYSYYSLRLLSSNVTKYLTHASHSNTGTKGQYLRNIVLQYMSTSDSDVRAKLGIAIGKMLNFSSTEMKSVQTARGSGWFF